MRIKALPARRRRWLIQSPVFDLPLVNQLVCQRETGDLKTSSISQQALASCCCKIHCPPRVSGRKRYLEAVRKLAQQGFGFAAKWLEINNPGL
jgi:hypothetical protein